jgi:hypothetical protein
MHAQLELKMSLPALTLSHRTLPGVVMPDHACATVIVPDFILEQQEDGPIMSEPRDKSAQCALRHTVLTPWTVIPNTGYKFGWIVMDDILILQPQILSGNLTYFSMDNVTFSV